MSLTLPEILVWPSESRREKDILLNIPSFKRKCDLFYYLSDKEAYTLIKYSELHRYSQDLVIPEADTHLCILLKGKVSLCHKILNLQAKRAALAEKSKQNEENKKIKDDEEVKLPPTSAGRRNAIKRKETMPVNLEEKRNTLVHVVDELLSRRKKTMENEEAANIIHKLPTSPTKAKVEEQDTLTPLMNIVNSLPTRSELYGKSIWQHFDGGCFGGKDMGHIKSASKNDQYVYVADVECSVIVIPLELQETIVGTHYRNNIENKEKIILENPITKHITTQQKHALGHEILEQHFVHGNTIIERGKPSDCVFLITSGFARLYVEIKIPKDTLSPAIQHLPSTKLRQRLKKVEVEVMDIGPGEFVGGLEQLFDSDKYLFTVRASTAIVAYNMRSEEFKEILLRPNSKSLQLFTENLKKKFQLRSQTCNFAETGEVDEVVSELLGVDKTENQSIPEVLKADNFRARSRHCVPLYMKIEGSENNKKKLPRTINRGPFSDRVRKRMIELGFKSRRGT